jgi:hypothetical protein
MIQISVNILKFGSLGVKSAPYDAFEVIHFKPGTNGQTVARIEVEKSDHPQLTVIAHEPRELSGNPGSVAAVESARLGTWTDEASTHFTLTVSGAQENIEFVLSGRRGHHNFWWRLQLKIVNGEVVLQGPVLANDPHS